MKRIFTVLMISSLLLIFAACGQTGKALSPDIDKNTQQNGVRNEPTDAGSSKTGKDETQSTENQKDNTRAADTYANNSNSNTIVAKSDNIVASQDKAAILKELDKELDELFSSMNELEDLEDSDLE